jgi:hypothetical protein
LLFALFRAHESEPDFPAWRVQQDFSKKVAGKLQENVEALKRH